MLAPQLVLSHWRHQTSGQSEQYQEVMAPQLVLGRHQTLTTALGQSEQYQEVLAPQLVLGRH